MEVINTAVTNSNMSLIHKDTGFFAT
jgi:hypothetical protein